MVDMESVRNHLVALSKADPDCVYDVNNTLPMLCVSLGLDEPTWDDERDRFVFGWEDLDDDD
jgi:hypothetical protein